MYKPLLLVLSLSAATATAALLHANDPVTVVDGTRTTTAEIDHGPIARAQQPRIEAVFVLDTTGSMGGMIEAAKRRIWSIAASMARAEPAPEVLLGLVAYRDRGDAYVTRHVPLTRDLDAVHAALLQLTAEGGGDAPESVNQALNEAVMQTNWSTGRDVYRTIFLVGDAPPKTDYQDDVPWQESLELARNRAIVVNTLLYGNDDQARDAWVAIAAGNQGRFLAVADTPEVPDLETPYDGILASLAAKLDATRLAYGSADVRSEEAERARREVSMRASAPATVMADRAAYNATKAGDSSFAARNDLVEDVASGRIVLEDLDEAELPEKFAALPEPEQRAQLEEIASERAGLRQELGEVAAKREEWLAKERAKAPAATDSLEARILDTVAEQAAERGLAFEREGTPEG